MKHPNSSNSIPARILSTLGLILGFILFSYMSKSLLLSTIGAFVGYKGGRKVGDWLSVKAAALIALFSGGIFLLLRLLGLKVLDIVFENIVESAFF